MVRKIILLIFAAGALGACNEYTTAICPSIGKSDYVKFEQNHILRLYDSKGHESVEAISRFQKVAEGTYLADSGYKYLTCVVAGRRIVETYSTDAGTFSLQLVGDQPDGYELSFIGFDQKELDAASIPYHLIANTTALWTPAKVEAQLLGMGRFLAAAAGEEPTTRLIVDNDKILDQAALVKLGKPMGLQYRFYKQVP